MKTNNNILSLNEMANTGNKWAVITIDETYYWRKDIAKKAKKTEGVYLINLMEPTHLCSIDVAFPAIWLRNFFHKTEKFDEDELTQMELVNEDGEEVRYYSEYMRPKLVKYYEDGEEEEILEYESGNPSYC